MMESVNKRILAVSLLLSILSISAGSLGCTRHDDVRSQNTIDIASALSGTVDSGYSVADKPVEFSFPRDHGPHESFRNEWWYFTGNLYDDTNRRFGYQLTFFRISLSPQAANRSSDWATNQIYMAHLAVSDVENKEFYAFEKINRDALGLAGFEEDPFQINVEDWYIAGQGKGDFPWRLYGEKDGISVSLEVEPLKDIVLMGDNGLSRKSLEGNNASYYYSITRLSTDGYIRINGEKYKIHGSSWLDREWSTSALSEEQAGWDWFSLQFDDSTDIMYFQLRNKDGSVYPYNEGLIVNPDGSQIRLGTGDIRLKVKRTWQSPLGGVYPVEWEAEIVPLDKTVIINAVFPGQELDLSTVYWEGAVDIYDEAGPANTVGQGYMELTGYGENSGR